MTPGKAPSCRSLLAGLAAGFLALALFLSSGPAAAGVWTLACLAGVDNDPLPGICAVVDPSGKDGIRDARQKWLERNQQMLKEVRSACDARLRRAYGNDEGRIRTAEAEMAHYVSRRKQELLSDPRTASNCRAYASALAQGGPKIDYTQEWIKAIEDSPMELPDFSKR